LKQKAAFIALHQISLSKVFPHPEIQTGIPQTPAARGGPKSRTNIVRVGNFLPSPVP
jgi:hypothetical protein